MKIVIIGTSNSVRRNGWVNGLESIHNIEVINYSRGRVPCLMHLVSIFEHKEIIQNADFLILDHFINDLNQYLEHFEDDYYHYIEDLLAMASSLNKPVINLFLPMMRKEFTDLDFHLNKVIKLCIKYHIYYINFNNYVFEDYWYDDKVHLKREIAFFLGSELGKLLKTDQFNTKTDIRIKSNPYKLLTCQDIVYENSHYSNQDIKTFTNSLAEFKYISLGHAISLSRMKGSELIAIAYFNELDKNHFFQISTQNQSFAYRTAGKLFFLEMMNFPILIDNKTYLTTPNNLDSNIPTLLKRKEIVRKELSQEINTSINISYLLFKDNNKSITLDGHKIALTNECFVNVDHIMQNLIMTFEEKLKKQNTLNKTLLERAEQIQNENTALLADINIRRVAGIIREALKQIKQEIDSSEKGIIEIFGFGNFNIRQREQDKKKLKKIIFRPKLEGYKNWKNMQESSVEANVLRGKDGWIFLFQGGQSQFDYLTGEKIVDQCNVNNFIKNIVNRKLFYDSKKIVYRHVIFPSKPLLKSQYLPDAYKNIESLFDKYYYDKLFQETKGNCEEYVYYPLNDLKKIELQYSTFRKFDTHMTDRSYLEIMNTLLKSLNIDIVNEQSFTSKVKRNRGGDLCNMLSSSEKNSEDHLYVDPGLYYQVGNREALPGNTNEVIITHTKNAKSNLRLLIFGDSFFKQVIKYLAPYFIDILYIRSSSVHNDIVDLYQPDVIFTGNAERYLRKVKLDINKKSFLFTLDEDNEYRPSAEYLDAFKANMSFRYQKPTYLAWKDKIEKIGMPAVTLLND